ARFQTVEAVGARLDTGPRPNGFQLGVALVQVVDAAGGLGQVEQHLGVANLNPVGARVQHIALRSGGADGLAGVKAGAGRLGGLYAGGAYQIRPQPVVGVAEQGP
nr:hypothetical protein [Tanacetum cinerariifolium]